MRRSRVLLAVLSSASTLFVTRAGHSTPDEPPLVLWSSKSGAVVGCVGSPIAAPAVRPATRIGAAELQADLSILRRALEALHPGLGRTTSRAEAEAAFDDLGVAWSHEQTLADAFLALARCMARLRCSHTYPNPLNQSDAVAAELFAKRRSVPFGFRWIDGRMIVTRDATAQRVLARGTEVLAIDDVPASEILARLLPLARADGANDAQRVRSLELSGDDAHAAFDVYFPLLWPRERDDLDLAIRAPGASSVEHVHVRAVTAEERDRALDARGDRADESGAPLWTVAPLADGTPCLRMASWVTFHSKWDWRHFVDATFDDLLARGAPNLVIDLRGNEGGTDVGNAILARLVDRETPAAQIERFVHARRTPPDLDPHLDTWDDSFRDWGDAATPAEGGLFRLVRADDSDGGGTIRPKAPRFNGRVFVLVDAANSSATFQFALALRTARLGELVGRATGGNQRGIQGGAFFFLRLPRSGFEVDLPLIGQWPPGDARSHPDAGIEPDVAVPLSVEDVATARDPDLAAVLARIAALSSASDERR